MPSEHIALTLKDKILSESETINSVGYIQGLVMSKLNIIFTYSYVIYCFEKKKPLKKIMPYQFFAHLDAHISNAIGKKKKTTSNAKQDNTDKLEIKIQADGRKRPFITYIGPTDQLIALAFACAEEFKCEVEKVAIE